MRGVALVTVACACGAVTAFQVPAAWRPPQQLRLLGEFGGGGGRRRARATSIVPIALDGGRQQQQQQQHGDGKGTGSSSSSGSSNTRLHAASLFGFESLLQPAGAAAAPNKEAQQPQQQQPHPHPHPHPQSEAALEAARAKEQLERGVSRLAMTYGWCLSPSDEAYLAEARAALEPSLAHLSEAERARAAAALEVAYHAHLGQRRKSGEPYIVHPVAVARLVADMGLDGETVAAALLHDTVEDTMLRAADVEAVFGPAVRQLVEAETKVSKLPRQLVSVLEAGLSDKAAANLCHLVFAMARDWRVVVVKLADRLHNMRTLGFMAPAKQQSVSKETLAVYVPLAERLGLNSVKAELEELAFSYLHPLEYAAVTAALASRQALLATLHTNRFGGARMAMDAALTDALPRLLVARGSLKGHRVAASLEGANPFEVYRRWAAAAAATTRGAGAGMGAEAGRGRGSGSRALLEEGPVLDGERDLLSLKVVVSSSSSSPDAESKHALCTRVLEAVEAELHAAADPGAHRVEDYVRFPKANGYQALHAVLRVPGLPYPLQVRVQTEAMERVARHGLLALYAPGGKSSSLAVSCSSSSAAVVGDGAAVPVPLQLPWLEAISARTRRAVLRDPSVTAAQLIESLQEELAVKQLQWAEAAQQAGAAGGRLTKPTAGDVLDFVVRSAMAASPEEQAALASAAAAGRQEAGMQQSQQQQQQSLAMAAEQPFFWQTPTFLWPWCLIGNDDFVTKPSSASASASASARRHRELQRQARGAVTAQPRAPGAFDSGEVQWLREAEQRHGRMALALLAWWGLLAATDWANAASATALAAAELADILEGTGAGVGSVDASVLMQTLLATPWGLPPLPTLSPELVAVVGAGELVGSVLPNSIDVNKRWQEAREQRRARQQRRRRIGAEEQRGEAAEEEEDGVLTAAADAQAAMAATAKASRSKQRQAAVGFIPLIGGSASSSSSSSGGVGGALLQLEAPRGVVIAFEGLRRAEKLMGRLGMATVVLLLAALA